MKQNFNEMINAKLEEIFHGATPDDVLERVNEEKEYFLKHNLIEFLELSSIYVQNMKEQLGDLNCCHSRGVIGGSYVLYLLGINDINPLKSRQYYSEKFGLIDDGYDISFEVFKKYFEKHNFNIELSYFKPSFTMTFGKHQLKFIFNKVTELTYKCDYMIPELFDYSTLPYDEFILDMNNIKNIVDKKTLSLIYDYNVVNFEELQKVIAISWGVRVIEANTIIGRTALKDMIVTFDDLFNLLKDKLGNELAVSICDLANHKKDHCLDIVDILKKNEIDNDLITFIEEFDYMTTKSHVIADAKKLVKLLYVKMDSPEANEGIHI